MGFKCLRTGTNLTLNSAEDLCILPAGRERHTAWEIWGRTENRHRNKLSSNREVSDHGAGGQEPLELETAGEASWQQLWKRAAEQKEETNGTNQVRAAAAESGQSLVLSGQDKARLRPKEVS